MHKYLTVLLLLSCRTIGPPAEPYVLDVPHFRSTKVTNDEYVDSVPLCDHGPTCDEGLFFTYLEGCKERDGITSQRLCEIDERSHYEWCLTFHELYDAACRELRPGNDPGPSALCVHACSDVAGAMNSYECSTGSKDCISHNHYWRLLCEKSCAPVAVLTTWGSGC